MAACRGMEKHSSKKPHAVTVLRHTTCPGVRLTDIRADARMLLETLGEPDEELTIVLVDDALIRDLNRRFRKKDRSTDVLAFAMREGRRAPGDERLLGDIVISIETATRQARQHRRSVAAELRTLVIHGVLHLLGYDHERSAAQARRMRAKERELGEALGDWGFGTGG